jgi:hypothetical protein
MLLVAASCRFSAQNPPTIQTKNNIYFFPEREKEKRKRKEKKKICKLNSNVAAAVKVFGKILPEAQRRHGDFFKNPQGLTFTAGKRTICDK